MLALIEDLVLRGHEVHLLVMNGRGSLMHLIPQPVRIFNFDVHRIRSTVLPLTRYLAVEKPDAVHAQMWPMTIIAIIARAISRTRPRLMISDQVALTKHMSSALQLTALRWSVRLFYPHADIRVICSREAADDIRHHSKSNLTTFDVITNPINPPDLIVSTSKVELLWGDAEGRIINVGSLKTQKNQSLLLRAFAQSVVRPNSKLMIVGEGSLRSELEALASSLGIAHRVIMPGFEIDPWPYYASADLFVLSSDYEGFPLVLAEAMYAGLRIISTDCLSGPQELTRGGKFGQLVPCGDIKGLASAIDRSWDLALDVQGQRDHISLVAGKNQIVKYSSLLTQKF